MFRGFREAQQRCEPSSCKGAAGSDQTPFLNAASLAILRPLYSSAGSSPPNAEFPPHLTMRNFNQQVVGQFPFIMIFQRPNTAAMHGSGEANLRSMWSQDAIRSQAARRKVACLGYGGGRLRDEIRGRRGRRFEKYYSQQQYALYAKWRRSGADAELRNL